MGKGTVVIGLRKKRPDIWLSVSVTTRSPRPGEVDGREYYFVSDAVFDRMVEDGELLEWAAFAGHRYGTPREPVARCIASITRNSRSRSDLSSPPVGSRRPMSGRLRVSPRSCHSRSKE